MNNLIKYVSANRWLGVVLIVLLGAIAYHNCLPNEMFWDDDDFINNNRYILPLNGIGGKIGSMAGMWSVSASIFWLP
jgi:hypothetical protein